MNAELNTAPSGCQHNNHAKRKKYVGRAFPSVVRHFICEGRIKHIINYKKHHTVNTVFKYFIFH